MADRPVIPPRKKRRTRSSESKKRPLRKRRGTLDQDTIDQFCQLVDEGLPFDGVCDYLGIDTKTFWEWRTRGDRALLLDEVPKADRLHAEFVLLLKKATAGYRLGLVRKLHGDKDWFRYLQILSRRDRANFGKNEPPGGGIEDYDPDEGFV